MQRCVSFFSLSLSLSLSLNIYMYTHMCVFLSLSLSLYMYIHMYIYMCVCAFLSHPKFECFLHRLRSSVFLSPSGGLPLGVSLNECISPFFVPFELGFLIRVRVHSRAASQRRPFFLRLSRHAGLLLFFSFSVSHIRRPWARWYSPQKRETRLLFGFASPIH